MLPDSGAHSHTRPANWIGLPANSPGRVTTLLADHIAVVCVCISIHGEKKKILHFSSGPCGDQFCHSCTGRCDRERGRREILARACGSAAVINAVISSSARNVLCVCVCVRSSYARRLNGKCKTRSSFNCVWHTLTSASWSGAEHTLDDSRLSLIISDPLQQQRWSSSPLLLADPDKLHITGPTLHRQDAASLRAKWNQKYAFVLPLPVSSLHPEVGIALFSKNKRWFLRTLESVGSIFTFFTRLKIMARKK